MDIINALRVATESIRDWVNDKKVDKDGNKKLTDENYTASEKARVKNMVTGIGIVGDKLYLKNDDGIIESSATTLPSGGGSGGGSSASITLTNLLDSNELAVALGGSANLKFEYESSETDEYTAATAYIYVGETLKKTYTVYPGENILDIGEVLAEGLNAVKLTVSDIYSNQKSLAFSVNVISLRITSSFDDAQIYNGDITLRYLPYGAVSKEVHLVINGADAIIATTSVTGVQQTHIISADTLSHGAHDVEMYLAATVEGVTITSNILKFCIIEADSGVTTPIISSLCNVTEITQGEQIQIDYLCYDPVSLSTEVVLTIYNGDDVYSQTTRTVDATKQLWSIRNVPCGDIRFEIAYGAIKRIHIVKVLENDINIAIKNTDLEFNLSAEGKSNEDSDRDSWENNGVSTELEYLNYESTGWVETESGTALRLFGKATAKILFQPFSSDARQYGRTIELDFAIRSVNNRDAVAVKCMYGGVGFVVGADKATISSEQTSVHCNYTDEERVKIAFVMEPKTEARLLSVYINGILSGVKQYADNDNFEQSVPQYIEIGSPYCSIDLYSIRSYKTCLSAREIFQNYNASITDIAERLALYEDNDIYDIYGSLSFEEVKKRMPTVLITCPSLPSYKGDKKNVTVDFTHHEKATLNYTDTAKCDVQGTSSQFLPKKNYKLKFSNYHQIDTDQIETNVICIKADYAEATSCRNTGSAKYIHTLYGDSKVPPQLDDSRVRTTIYGYPVAVFWRSDSTMTPVFLYKGNYNYDKSSSEAFSFTSDYPDAFSIEFCNNTSDACRFHGEIPEKWGDDFEYRHPDGYEDIADSGFKEMHSWVVSTYQDAATDEILEAEYIGTDGTIYTHDTAAYRLAKFKKEFTEHFDMDFALIYYILTFLGLYIDSRCKNLFLTTFDRQHFYAYFYDMDTSWSINNEGVVSLTPYLTDTDLIDNTHVFNGQDSTLWTNFMMAFPDEIAEKYAQLRSDGLISYDKLVEYFIEQQCNKFSASIYNEDSEEKYISMLRSDNDASNLYQVRGSGESHFRYFAKERIDFCDSYWNCGDYPDDFVSLRIYTPLEYGDVEPNANITITPYTDGYFGVRYKANGTQIQQRAYANTPTLFEAPNETFDDTETAVFGASRISSFGDLSPLYCGTVNLSAATNLVEIIVGAGGDYVNNNLKTFAVGANKLLKKVDIRNCPSLTDALNLSECPSIEEIQAQGSSIAAVNLPKSGFLRKIYLPETLTNLTITNQKYIEEFVIDGYDALTTLHIEDVVNVPVEDIMLNAPNLNRIRLIGVNWEAESEEAFAATIAKFKNAIGMDAMENNIGKPAVVTGRVKIDSISDELFAEAYESFPDLIIDDGTGKPYVINFLDRDGNSLYSVRLADGEDVIDPIEAGIIERPADLITDDYTYEFVGWSSLPKDVHQSYRITPVYKMKYAIKYYSGDEIVYESRVYHGEPAIDPVEKDLIPTPTKEGSDDLRYVFDGWDNLPVAVQGAMEIHALFANVYPVHYYADGDLHYTQWIKETNPAYDPIAAGECEVPADVVTENEKKLVFSAWDNIPESVTGVCQVNAQYDTYWAARFWNDDDLYLLQWVLDGADVVEPERYFEDYVDPTRESTAQYDYYFLSWDGERNNVTNLRNLVATYTNVTRTYTVYFYNGTELLQTFEDIPYGGTATYNGAEPVKPDVDDPTEYAFKGWLPAPEAITGDTKCYAYFKFMGYLFGKLAQTEDTDEGYGTVDDPNWDAINAYWDVIGADVKAYKNGELSLDELKVKYPIGGRMLMAVTLSDDVEYQIDVEVIGYDHDDLADGTGKATLTFFCKDLPAFKKKMYNSNSNSDGWGGSDMREFTNGELYEALPEKLHNLIKPVIKVADGGINNQTLVENRDYCWLLSFEEIGCEDNDRNLEGQGVHYADAYGYGASGNSSRIKTVIGDTGKAGWWLRSSSYGTTAILIMRVQTSGAVAGDGLWNAYCVAFGFCI